MAFDEKWEEVFSGRAWGKYPSEPVIRFVVRNFNTASARSKIKILDLGCGGGAHLCYLAKEGFDAYGIDGSISAIKQTKSLLQQERLEVQHLKVGDIVSLDYPDSFFDAVIDANSIQHNSWKNIQEAHSEIKRILKPAGKFLSIIVNDQCNGYESAKEIEKNTFVGMENSYFIPGVLTHLLTKSELKLLMSNFKACDIEVVERMCVSTQDKISRYVWSGEKE